MNTKDAIRQRRRDKIKRLMEQQQAEPRFAPPSKKPHYAERPRAAYPETSFLHEPDEPDPEKLWKKNPNPWLGGWGTEEGGKYAESDDYKGGPGRGAKPFFWNGLRWKLLAAALLFGAVWGMFRYDIPLLSDGRSFVKEALTKEMDFDAVAVWYRETFAGAPSFIPIFEVKRPEAQSVDGTVKQPVVSPLADGVMVKTFAELLSGIELAGDSDATVAAAQTGRVRLVTGGGEGSAGATVVIQHSGGRMTIYGGLGSVSVQKDDWVEAGDGIGRLRAAEGDEPSLLYFAVKQNERFLDPADVIPFD